MISDRLFNHISIFITVRRALGAVLLILLWSMLCSTAMAQQKTTRDGRVIYDTDLKISVPFNIGAQQMIELDASVYMPAPVEGEPEMVYPTMVMPTSWSTPRFIYEPVALNYARKGYQFIVYTPRGFLGSGGPEARIEVASKTDINDAKTVIDWAIANGGNRHAIGMIGVSYGGGISLLTATQDERIKVAIPLSAWSDLQVSLAPGLTPRIDYIDLLNIFAIISGKRSPQIQENIDNLYNLTNIPETLVWAHERSAIDFWDAVNARQTPLALFAVSNAQDELFQADTIVDLLNLHQGPKRFDFNIGPHGVPDVVAHYIPFNYTWDRITRWMDHYLKGEDNGIQCLDPVNWLVSSRSEGTPMRESYSDFPANNPENIKTYYLHPETDNSGTLQTSAYTGEDITLQFSTTKSIVENGWLPEHIFAHRQWDVATFDLSHGVIFKMPLEEDIHLRGSAKVHFKAPVEYSTQFFAYLLEYDRESKTSNWIGHGSYTFIPRDGSKPDSAIDSEVSIQFLFNTEDIQAGKELVLVIDGRDRSFLNPEQKPKTNYIDFSATTALAARLEIPTVETPQRVKNPPLFGTAQCASDIDKAQLKLLGRIPKNKANAAVYSTGSSSGGGSIAPTYALLISLLILYRRRNTA